MPFNPGDKVTLTAPISPQGISVRDGIVLADMGNGVYRVDVGGYALLVPEGDINGQAAQQQSGQSNVGVQGGQAALGIEVRAESQEPGPSQGDSPVGSPQGGGESEPKARPQKPRKAPKRKTHVKKGKHR